MTTHPKPKKTVLVTGGANRIGRSICIALAAIGYRVALHYHHSKRAAEKTAAYIVQKGGTCSIFPCDLKDETQTERLIPEVLKRYHHCDVLVNNASLFETSSIKSLNIRGVRTHFEVNFMAPYILIAQFARFCKQGDIINLLDTHILNHRTSHTAYLLSKKALCALTKISAVELSPKIRVNAIAPGLILPPKGVGPGYLTRLAKDIPLKCVGNVRQIVTSIEFLLNNPYLTGQIIFNDGGEHLL